VRPANQVPKLVYIHADSFEDKDRDADDMHFAAQKRAEMKLRPLRNKSPTAVLLEV
jgi:hypothetical protein